MTELDALLILNAIPGLSNLKKREMVAYYGSALKILTLPQGELLAEKAVSETAIKNILNFSKDKFLKDEYNLIASHDVSVFTETDEQYPDLLKEIDDSPLVLYVRGTIPSSINLSVSIVGSRNASVNGRLIAEKFAYQLSEIGLTIVSGLARGIDTSAHQGALRAKGKTVAVLGSGLACIYPKENTKLFQDIVASSSAVVSEYPMQTAPLPYNFPRRNRIISGLSLAIIVVEAAAKSGALITVDFGLEQGREVFAVPNMINHPTAEGVNNLIKHGAKVATSIDDIVDHLNDDIKEYLKSSRGQQGKNRIEFCVEEGQAQKKRSVAPNEQILYDYLEDRPLHIDELVRLSGLSSSFASSILLQLELKNKVKQLPGKLFRKV